MQLTSEEKDMVALSLGVVVGEYEKQLTFEQLGDADDGEIERLSGRIDDFRALIAKVKAS